MPTRVQQGVTKSARLTYSAPLLVPQICRPDVLMGALRMVGKVADGAGLAPGRQLGLPERDIRAPDRGGVGPQGAGGSDARRGCRSRNVSAQAASFRHAARPECVGNPATGDER